MTFFGNPSAYIGQPYRHAGNQIGHVALGAATVWLLSAFLSMPWLALAWVVASVLWLAWEAGQVVLFRAEPFDALEDMGFFVTGIMAYAIDPLFLIPGAIFCASGFYRRLSERDG